MRKSARKLLESIAKLRSTIKACRARLGCRLAERHAARQAAVDPTVAYGPIFDHLEAELETVASDFTAAENGYEAEQILVAQFRRRRGGAVEEVHERHSQIERFCRSQPGLKGAGIVGSAPTSPRALVQQVSRMLEFLRGLEADAAAGRNTPVLTTGVRLDAGAVADQLEGGLPRLRAALAALEEAEAGVVLARERANVGFAEADRVSSWVARTLDGLSSLAGEPAGP